MNERSLPKISEIRDEPNAGETFSKFIETELVEECARRASLDARGIGVLNTSGAFATLLFALGAFAAGAEGAAQSRLALILLALASIAFVSAGLIGLLANRLQKYKITTPAQLLAWRASDSKWHDSPDKARRVVSLGNIKTIESLRSGNNSKAKYIEAALWFQFGAVVLLAGAVATAVLY